MEIRRLTLDDREAAIHIYSRSFSRGVTFEIEPERFMDPARVRLGLFEEGRLQAAYSILDYRAFFGDLRLPVGGIAGVATEPASRGRGHVRQLISRSFEWMREHKQFLSLLWPFDQRFYRLYGWEWVGWSQEFAVPARLLSSSPEARYVEPVFADHAAAFNSVYEVKAARYNGPIVRDEKRWLNQMKPWDKSEAAGYLYRRDGQAEGYAILKFDPKDEKVLRATELVANTARAYRGLLGLLHHHGMLAETFKWSGAMDDPLWSFVSHWDVETKLEHSGMGRIVDVEAALSARAAAPEVRGAAVVQVKDAHAEWNNGTFLVELEGGAVTVTRTTDEPGVSLEINTLSQAYWGTPSLLDLRERDLLEVRDEAQFQTLLALLPPRKVWLYDDF